MSISETLNYLKDNNIEAFELMNVIVIPVSDPSEIVELVSRAEKLFKECGYKGKWQVDPYYNDPTVRVSEDF